MKRKMKMDQILRRYWPGLPKHEVEAAGERIWKRLQEDLKQYDTSLRSLYGDGWIAPATTQLEFQVLTAISALGERADLHSVTRMVEGWRGRDMIVKALFAIGDLANRRLVKVHRLKPANRDDKREFGLTLIENGSGAPSKDDDGPKPEIRYTVTENGELALRRAHAEGRQLMATQEDEARGHCF